MNIEQLMPFCSKDETRPEIMYPFTRGEWTYGTDGRIAVRVPAIPGVAEGSVKAESVFDGLLSGEEIPLPEIPPPAFEACHECDGIGAFNECSECDGNGEIECCECGTDISCKKCNGDGLIAAEDGLHKCTSCEGERTVETIIRVDVGCSRFNVKPLRAIAELPGCRFFLTGELTVSRFTFDGGEGAIMPMRRDLP